MNGISTFNKIEMSSSQQLFLHILKSQIEKPLVVNSNVYIRSGSWLMKVILED